jgi:regulator of RNase E activity RraA
MGRILSPDELERLKGIDTPTLSNAIELYQVRDRTTGYLGRNVRCLFPELGTMVGYAVTVTADSTTPGPPPGREGFIRWLRALEAAPKPIVVVIKDISARPELSCHFGEVMSTLARRLGAVGLVTDGGVRDLLEAKALGFHYFAAGAVCSHGNPVLVETNVPVEIDGVTINPGDLIHADLNGVLIVPTEVVPQVFDGVEQVRRRERRVMDYASSPDFTLDGLVDILTH